MREEARRGTKRHEDRTRMHENARKCTKVRYWCDREAARGGRGALRAKGLKRAALRDANLIEISALASRQCGSPSVFWRGRAAPPEGMEVRVAPAVRTPAQPCEPHCAKRSQRAADLR